MNKYSVDLLFTYLYLPNEQLLFYIFFVINDAILKISLCIFYLYMSFL